MSVCLCCSRFGEGSLCGICQRELRVVGALTLGSGLDVRAGYVHRTVARRLVHILKYEGIAEAAEVLARGIVHLLPSDSTALIPVPRAVARRVKHGIDPAVAIARAVGRRCGLPVIGSLQAQLWWPRHAGRTRGARQQPRFRLVGRAPAGAVLVDDVLTTGATLEAAAYLSGATKAITATRAV